MAASVFSSEAWYYKASDASGTLPCVMCNLLHPLFIYVHVAIYNVNNITRTSLVLQGTFLPLVVPPNSQQIILWSTWLVLLCSLKVLLAITSNFWDSTQHSNWNKCHIQMFQSLARERLECLNASPSATPLKYLRVYSALLLVLSTDLLW